MICSTLKTTTLLVPLVMLSYIAPGVLLRETHGTDRSEALEQTVGQDRLSGSWKIHAFAGSQKAQLQLTQTGNDWGSVHVPLQQLRGINATTIHAGSSKAEFQLVRDAGTLAFTGIFSNGSGSGQWTFQGNSAFTTQLRKLGYEQLTEDQLYRLALNNIGAPYIGELAQAGYRNLSTPELIALYSNDVRADYINSLAAAGYSQLSPKKLIALKSNGVNDAYIRSLQSRGYRNLSVERLLSIRTNPGN